MTLKSKALLIVFAVVSGSSLYAISKGSDSVISIEPHFTFTNSTLSNQMLTFGFFKNGFALADSDTECIFGSTFPVSGNVSLHGGKLTLSADLIFQNKTILGTSGEFFADGHTIDLCQTVTGLPATEDTLFNDAKVVTNCNLTITGTVKCTGDCIIDGRNNSIILGDDGHIIVGHDSTLVLRNVELFGVHSGNIRCMDHSSKLILDNIRWVQKGDYTFTSGSIKIVDVAQFVGPYTFKYDSSLTSTIDTDSSWYFSDVVKFEVGRKDGVFGREPIYMEDITSILKLENCYWTITSSGIQMTRGDILMDRDVRIQVDSTSTVNGLIVGNGNEADDLKWELYPKAAVSLESGHLVHKIVKRQNFASENVEMTFQRRGNSVYYSTKNTHYENVDIHNYDSSSLIAAEGAELFFDRCHIFAAPVELFITVTFENDYTNQLNGNGELRLVRGSYPLISKIKGTGNRVHGKGDISGPMILENHLTELAIGLDGAVTYDIAMNGGKIILQDDFQLGLDTLLSGSGTVRFTRCDFHVRLRDKTWTGSTLWDGDGGTIRLEGDMSLATEFSFSGDCTINGAGYRMYLHDAAHFVVRPNSTLRLKHVIIDGINDDTIRCLTDSGKIIFDEAILIFNGDYTFSQGSILFQNNVEFLGTHTFAYESALTSTIADTSRWTLDDGMSLKLGRSVAQSDREPLYFSDKTSVLSLNGASITITPSGANFTRGTLDFGRDVLFDIKSTDSRYGFIIGDNIASNDLYFTWQPGAVIRFMGGTMVYNNLDKSSLQPRTSASRINLSSAFNLYVNQDMTWSQVTVGVEPAGFGLIIKDGKFLDYQGVNFAFPSAQFKVTGKRYSAFTNLLDGDGRIIIGTGGLPLATMVTGAGNLIEGSGGIVGPVALIGSDAELNLGVSGIATNISIAGGEIIAQQGLVFSENRLITGYGNVNLANLYAHIGGQDMHWSSTINWDCSNGLVITRTSLDLSSRWTFSGTSILWGMGNILNLGATGELVVERGSTLIIRDVTLDRVTRDRIRCLDNAGKIIFDGVTWVQDHNCTFSVGKFEVAKYLDMYGEGYTFSYQSPLVSGISDRAKLQLNDYFEFSYAPTSTARNLLALRGSESKIIMDGATLHSTQTGLQLTRGEVKVYGNCSFKSDALYKAEGIIAGDGVSSSNDLAIDIYAKAKLELVSGHLVYKNVG